MIKPVDINEIPEAGTGRWARHRGKNQSDIDAFLSSPYEAVAVDLRGRSAPGVATALAKICKQERLPIVCSRRGNAVFLVKEEYTKRFDRVLDRYGTGGGDGDV